MDDLATVTAKMIAAGRDVGRNESNEMKHNAKIMFVERDEMHDDCV